MRFKIDENLPADLGKALVSAGHEAATVHEERLQGVDDKPLLTVCDKEQRAIITLDVDFGNIRTYPPDRHHGIVVLRLSRQDKPYVLRCFRQVLVLLAKEPLAGKLWIVEDARVRIRGKDE